MSNLRDFIYTEINRIWCGCFSKRKQLWTSEEDIYRMKSICRELNAQACSQSPASCILTLSSKLPGYTFKEGKCEIFKETETSMVTSKSKVLRLSEETSNVENIEKHEESRLKSVDTLEILTQPEICIFTKHCCQSWPNRPRESTGGVPAVDRPESSFGSKGIWSYQSNVTAHTCI